MVVYCIWINGYGLEVKVRVKVKVKVKVNFSLEQATKVQRGSRV
jgi:hypothetical protein